MLERETWIALGVIGMLVAAMAVVTWAAFCPKHYVDPHPKPIPVPVQTPNAPVHTPPKGITV